MQVGRGEKERGAAVVEFALVIPLLMMLLVGMISSGILYNKQMQLTHAAREGARQGATMPENQLFPPATGDWADHVRAVVLERAAGELVANQVCVALVSGPTATEPVQAIGGNWTTQSAGTGAASRCFDDTGSGETEPRVQVKVNRPGELDAVFLHIDVNMGAKATARHESS